MNCSFQMLGIPQIVIMSMIYEVCPLVNRDLKNVYLSKTIKKKVSLLFLSGLHTGPKSI